MPNAVKRSDGSVSLTLSNGSTVNLSAADVAAAATARVAPPTVSPVSVKTASGRVYGTGSAPRFGVFYDSEDGSFYFLDKNMNYIPNSSWKPRNMTKAKWTFAHLPS